VNTPFPPFPRVQFWKPNYSSTSRDRPPKVDRCLQGSYHMGLSWGHKQLVANKKSTLFVFCLILEGCLMLGSSKPWKKQVGHVCLFFICFIFIFVCLFLIDECKRWAPGEIVFTSLLFSLEIQQKQFMEKIHLLKLLLNHVLNLFCKAKLGVEKQAP